MKTVKNIKKEQKPSSRFTIIAGPCSAESPQQLMQAAKALAATGKVDYFRAGIWKPRTMPGSFEGVGSKGLPWLQKVKSETGLPVCTEVASVKHVEQALRHNIDLVWIGARTVSNPFLIQEIAESLKGCNIRVMVKNPMAPDMDLWQGSIERFIRVGVTDVQAIHRGFSVHTKQIFRNQPLWEIPMELKRRMPELKIICDPSHISGKRSLVPQIALRGLQLGMDGLMVEVHPTPARALSDSAQQMTPQCFEKMLCNLSHQSDRPSGKRVLNEIRAEVDAADHILICALTSRMQLAGEIAGIKHKHNMKALQPGRWEKVMKQAILQGTQQGLRSGFIQRLFDHIHRESLMVQNKLKTEYGKNPENPPIFET